MGLPVISSHKNRKACTNCSVRLFSTYFLSEICASKVLLVASLHSGIPPKKRKKILGGTLNFRKFLLWLGKPGDFCSDREKVYLTDVTSYMRVTSFAKELIIMPFIIYVTRKLNQFHSSINPFWVNTVWLILSLLGGNPKKSQFAKS